MVHTNRRRLCIVSLHYRKPGRELTVCDDDRGRAQQLAELCRRADIDCGRHRGFLWFNGAVGSCWRLVSDVEILISGLSYHRKAWRPAEFKVSFYTA
jgi:hypothetical protein